MALVNVETSAFLVGKEGLNPKSSPIVTTGLIGIFEVGDEKDGFYVTFGASFRVKIRRYSF